MSEYVWIGPAISACSLAAVVWLNWGRQALRAQKLKKPVDAYLTAYAKAKEDSWARELHVPPGRTVQVQLRLKPRLTHQNHETIFGFSGPENDRPLPKMFRSEFIKTGIRQQQSPATNPDHYIDYNDCYHIREKSDRVVGNVYALGFEVDTRRPGRYPVILTFITETGEGLPTQPLTLVVETRP
ncbi:MAG TPA: hypothetical protein VHL34_04700 [Rhizomicrobium sp.]|jgi:hypothetical protein|nr:hypothetical protein [Rhizomicrobium sp.]